MVVELMFYVFQTKPTLLEAAETKSVLNTKPLDIPTRSGDSVYKFGALRDYSTTRMSPYVSIFTLYRILACWYIFICTCS